MLISDKKISNFLKKLFHFRKKNKVVSLKGFKNQHIYFISLRKGSHTSVNMKYRIKVIGTFV